MRDAASELSARTGFAFNPLDRMSERRDEESLVEALAAAPSSRAVVICRDSPVLLRHGPQIQGYMSLAEAESLGPIAVRAFLGKDEHGGVFGVLLDDAAAVAAPPGPHYAPKFHIAHRSDAVLEDLRALTATGQLDRGDDRAPSDRPKACSTGTRATGFAPIAARKRMSPPRAGGANARPAGRCIFRARTRSSSCMSCTATIA